MDWRGIGPSEHLVQIYEGNVFLLAAVGDFLGGALRSGGAGIAIVTPTHREQLEQWLQADGLD